MKYLYTILSFPAWIVFTMFFNRLPLMREDFEAWCLRYKLTNLTLHTSFVYLMRWYPEYRYVFYYRLPFYYRHVLNVFLRRRQLKMSGLHVGGGGDCRAWLEYNCRSRKSRFSFHGSTKLHGWVES